MRYLPPTPPPPPPTVAPPPPPPPATPAPPPPPAHYRDIFVAGDYIVDPKVYNEFSPGNQGTDSYAVRGAWEFTTWNIPWMIEGDWRSYGYPHDCASTSDPECYVTNIGGVGQSFVDAFNARQSDVDARLAIRVAEPRIYIGVGYLWTGNNYGYPSMRGWGFGAEKLPDLDQALSIYGSIWYYPTVEGTYTSTSGVPYELDYHLFRYEVGLDYVLGHSPLFIEIGWLGERGSTATFIDPSAYTINGPYAGIGIKL